MNQRSIRSSAFISMVFVFVSSLGALSSASEQNTYQNNCRILPPYHSIPGQFYKLRNYCYKTTQHKSNEGGYYPTFEATFSIEMNGQVMCGSGREGFATYQEAIVNLRKNHECDQDPMKQVTVINSPRGFWEELAE